MPLSYRFQLTALRSEIVTAGLKRQRKHKGYGHNQINFFKELLKESGEFFVSLSFHSKMLSLNGNCRSVSYMEIRDQTDHIENTGIFNERQVPETIKKPKPKQTKSIKQAQEDKKSPKHTEENSKKKKMLLHRLGRKKEKDGQSCISGTGTASLFRLTSSVSKEEKQIPNMQTPKSENQRLLSI